MMSGSPRVSGPSEPAQEAASMAATTMTAARGTTQILETVPTEIRLKHRLVLRDLGDRALRDPRGRGARREKGRAAPLPEPGRSSTAAGRFLGARARERPRHPRAPPSRAPVGLGLPRLGPPLEPGVLRGERG